MTTDTPSQEALRDALLVVRCQLGEAQAFDALARRWAGPLLRHVRRLAGAAQAEDIAQDVWVRVFRGIGGLRDGTRLKPWLFGIAHRAVMDRLRLKYSGREVAMEDVPDIAEEAVLCDEDRHALAEQGLAGLAPLERETLTLFYLEELSLLQIAEIQAVPPGTVKSRLFRARKLLRHAVQTQGEFHEPA